MTVDDRRHAATPRGWRVLAGGMVAALAFGYASLGVTAQDATPAALPTADCVAPELPPGSPTPMEEMASPEAEMDMASPEPAATPDGEAGEAAPVAPEAPVGTPADGEDADAAVGAAEDFFACVTAGDYEGAVALLTADFLLNEFGLTNPYDAVGFLEGAPFIDPAIDNPQTYEDGSVSVDVQYQSSEYQISKERWTFADEDGTWKLDGFSYEEPEFDGDVSVIGVLLGENEDGTYYITPNAPSDPQGEALILHGVNEGIEKHEIVAFGLPEGADPTGIFDGSIAEEDMVYYGSIQLDSGEQGDLMMVGLPVGVVTLVCFVTGPDGKPHAMNGMISEIEITEPVAV